MEREEKVAFDINALPDEAAVRNAINLGEGQCIELIASIRNALDLSRAVSAFANSQGGWIILGVQEPRKIIGIDSTKVANVLSIIDRRTKPSQSLTLHTVTLNQKTVGVIVVKPSRQLVVTDAGAFKRSGERIYPLSAADLETKFLSGQGFSGYENTIAELSASINRLIDSQKESHYNLTNLRSELRHSQSLKGQLRGLLVSWTVGFFLGILASYVANHLDLVSSLDMNKGPGAIYLDL